MGSKSGMQSRSGMQGRGGVQGNIADESLAQVPWVLDVRLTFISNFI